jgi:hypothetical protein
LFTTEAQRALRRKCQCGFFGQGRGLNKVSKCGSGIGNSFQVFVEIAEFQMNTGQHFRVTHQLVDELLPVREGAVLQNNLQCDVFQVQAIGCLNEGRERLRSSLGRRDPSAALLWCRKIPVLKTTAFCFRKVAIICW